MVSQEFADADPNAEFQNPAPQGTEAEAEASQDQPTLEELLAEREELKTKADKLENDLRSLQGGRKRQEERDNLLQRIAQDMEDLKATNAVLYKAAVEGDTETAAQEYQKVNQESQQRRQATDWQGFYEESWNELTEAVSSVKDKDGNTVLDLYNSPELEAMRQNWIQAQRNQDRAGIERALRLAERTAREKEREVPRQTEPTRERRPRRDNEAPPGVGGGTLNPQQFIRTMDEWQESGDPQFNEPKNQQRLREIVSQQLRRA